MRKLNYLLGMLAVAATFTACSSDDVVDGGKVESTGTAYMTVQIASANGGTRAVSENDFNNSTDAENAIKTVSFYFYDANGGYMTKGKTVTSLPEGTVTDDETTNNIAKVYDAVIALETTNEANTTTIKKVLAVVNSDVDLSGKSLSDAKKVLTDELGDGTNGFVMTNSVHGSNVDGVTAVTADNFSTSETEAKSAAKAVTIYVERLASKVNVSDTGLTVADMTEDIDGVATTLSAEIVGWGITATEPSEYLIKSISASGDYFSTAWTADGTSTSSWNDDSNHRCYWAETPNYNASASDYPSHGFTEDNPYVLNYLTYGEIVNKKEATSYCTEHTYPFSDDLAGKYLSASTSLLVLAQITVNGSETELIRFNGNLYSTLGYKNLIIINSGIGSYWKKTGENSYKELSAEDLIIPQDGKVAAEGGKTQTLVDGNVACQINTETTWYTKSGDEYTAVSADAITAKNVDLVDLSKAEGFNGGYMYYSIPIKHLVNRTSGTEAYDAPQATGEYGVVRNHVYDIKLTQIAGLGHAIWNPNEHIVPNVNEAYYLASVLKVLSWRIVPTQSVILK